MFRRRRLCTLIHRHAIKEEATIMPQRKLDFVLFTPLSTIPSPPPPEKASPPRPLYVHDTFAVAIQHFIPFSGLSSIHWHVEWEEPESVPGTLVIPIQGLELIDFYVTHRTSSRQSSRIDDQISFIRFAGHTRTAIDHHQQQREQEHPVAVQKQKRITIWMQSLFVRNLGLILLLSSVQSNPSNLYRPDCAINAITLIPIKPPDPKRPAAEKVDNFKPPLWSRGFTQFHAEQSLYNVILIFSSWISIWISELLPEL